MPVHVSLCRRWVSSFFLFFFCWKNAPKNYIALTLINPTNSNHLRAYHLFLSCSSVQQWSRLNPPTFFPRFLRLMYMNVMMWFRSSAEKQFEVSHVKRLELKLLERQEKVLKFLSLERTVSYLIGMPLPEATALSQEDLRVRCLTCVCVSQFWTSPWFT